MRDSSNVAEFRVVVPIVAGVGNALMAEPMVRQLKRRRPEARVTIIARIDAMAEPFRRVPGVEETLVYGKGVAGLWRMLRWTRSRRPDVFLVPFPSNRWQYNLLALLSGARRRILNRFPAGRWRALGFLPATRVPAVRGIHDVAQNLRLLEALGIEADLNDPPRFSVDESDRRSGDQLLRGVGIDVGVSFVAVHAGSGRTVIGHAKRWPAIHYAELIVQLRREEDQPIVLLEGPDEAGVGDEILRAVERHGGRTATGGISVLRLAGPLGDAAAVLERASLYIGSDSGLAHLAAAVGTKAVTIFAPGDPERVCPFGYRDLVVKPDKPCSPCLQYPWYKPYPKILCREPMCVAEVPVSAVIDAARRATTGMRVLVPSPSGSGSG